MLVLPKTNTTLIALMIDCCIKKKINEDFDGICIAENTSYVMGFAKRFANAQNRLIVQNQLIVFPFLTNKPRGSLHERSMFFRCYSSNLIPD